MSYETYRRLRDENEMNDFYVSRQTGIAAATLSSWKHGKYKPKFLTLATLAKFFNVPVETFLDSNEEVNHVSPVDDARIKVLEGKVADLEAQQNNTASVVTVKIPTGMSRYCMNIGGRKILSLCTIDPETNETTKREYFLVEHLLDENLEVTEQTLEKEKKLFVKPMTCTNRQSHEPGIEESSSSRQA